MTERVRWQVEHPKSLLDVFSLELLASLKTLARHGGTCLLFRRITWAQEIKTILDSTGKLCLKRSK
jgi:hypothetical protein